MKRLFMRSLATVIFLATSTLINAQEVDPRPYNSVADRIARAISEELPDWRRKSVPPINRDGLDNFSYEVIIDQWASAEARVRVVLFLHSSEAEAKNAFEKFTAGVRANERLPDVDSEAYAWGLNKSIALRRGSYAVYISSIALNVPSDDTVIDKRPKEEAKLSRTFAKIVSRALKELD